MRKPQRYHPIKSPKSNRNHALLTAKPTARRGASRRQFTADWRRLNSRFQLAEKTTTINCEITIFIIMLLQRSLGKKGRSFLKIFKARVELRSRSSKTRKDQTFGELTEI